VEAHGGVGGGAEKEMTSRNKKRKSGAKTVPYIRFSGVGIGKKAWWMLRKEDEDQEGARRGEHFSREILRGEKEAEKRWCPSGSDPLSMYLRGAGARWEGVVGVAPAGGIGGGDQV